MNIKTDLNAAKIAVDAIKDINVGAYVGTDGLFATDALANYKQQLEGLTVTQQKMALMGTNLTAAQREQVLAYISATAATKTLTAEQVLNCTADEKQLLVKAGLITAEELEKGSTIDLIRLKLEELIANKDLSASEKNVILNKFGVAGANLTEASSWEVLGKSILKSVAAKLKWLALTPEGWITLGVAAVVGAIVAYDKWGATLENTREKLVDLKSECDTITSDIESVNSELETTKQRLDELEGKDTLTFTEKEEYDNLVKQNNELQRQLDLQKLLLDEKNKEKNKTFVQAMDKNVEGKRNVVAANSGGSRRGKRLTPSASYTVESNIEQQFKNYQENLDKIADLDEQYKDDLSNKKYLKERERIKKENDRISEYLQGKNTEFTTDSEGVEYIDEPKNEDEEKVNKWLDFINDFQDRMAIAMGGDNAKKNAFNRVVDNWQFDDTVQGLQDLGKEGKVTADMLDDPKYADFIQKLVELKVIDSADNLEDIALAFNNVATSSASTSDSVDGVTSSLTSLKDAIKAVEDAYELFNDVQKDFNSSGVISFENIQKILAKFPDLEDELYEYIMGLRTGTSVMDLLKAKSDDMATMSAEAFRKMYMSSNMVSADIKATFAKAFNSVGLGWDNTKSVMANVNAKIIDNNGNVCTTFSEQWQEACKTAGVSVSVFASGLASLFSGGIDNILKENGNLYSYDKLTGEKVNLVDVQAVEIAQDLQTNMSNSKYWGKYGKYYSNGTVDKDSIYSDVSKYYHGVYNKGVANKEELEHEQKEFEEKLKKLGTSSENPSKDKSSSSSDTPSYESNVDAIINRIKRTSNLINKDIEDIDNQLELIDIEDDPEKYRGLINDKLKNQRQLDDLYLNAQNQLHNEAEYVRSNSGYNMASWFDEFGNETEAYYATFNSAKTKSEQERIKSLFDEVKKYKDAWEEMSDARYTANKDILDSEEKITECLEKQCELVETLAKAHNDSYNNEKTVLEREVSDLEHKKNITNSATEKTKINSQLRDTYRRGITLAEENMNNVYSDAEYWREHLKSLLAANGLDFDVSKWFNESGEILEQFNVDLAKIIDDNLKAEIQSDTNKVSEKKSVYMDFYEWRHEMEEKLNEDERSYIDDLKNAVDELFDLRISKIDSENTLLGRHYDLINSIAEEQHNLNKELAEANIAGVKMNEIERQTLFTKEEHAELSSKLNTLLKEAQDIQEDYTRDLATATKDTIEEVTNNYERQYELKLKEYEVVKAELNLAKAEQKLENVKNEKSVRTWNGTSWIYEAVLQDVIDAQNELADAKYEVQQAKIEKEQNEILNGLSATSDNLKTQQNQFVTSLEELSGTVTDASARVSEALNNLADVDLPMFKDLMFELGDILNETLELNLNTSKYSSKTSGGSSTFTYNPSTGVWTDNSTGKTTTSVNSTSTNVVGWQTASSLGLKSSKKTLTKEYAKGAKNTSAGLGLFDEEGDGSEVIITKYGKLRQFSAGETVFSKDMTDRLYNMVKGSYVIPSALTTTSDPSQYIKNDNNNSQDNRVYTINGITVGDNKGKEIIEGLADYLWRKS